MSTAPFHEDVAALITGPHTVAVAAVAYFPTGSPVALAVTGGRVSWSERRAPRVTADLEVATPTDPAVIAALDPRTRVRVKITVTYTLPNGDPDAHEVADLHLRRRAVLRPAGTLRLSLASDEALVIDAAPSSAVTAGTHPDTVNRADSPGWVRTLILNSLAWMGVPSPTVTVTAAGAAEWPYDVRDMWDTITDVADQLDLDVYDPGDRVFRVAPRPTVAAESVLTVKGGPGGILLDAESTVSRDEWANYVMLRYSWTTAAGTELELYGTARTTSGPFAVDTAGYKVLAEDRDTPTTQFAATKAAANLLRRMLSRSRGLDVSTVPAWWVRPGHTITYQPENGDQQRHLVSEVEHDLTAMTMRMVTRLPDTDSTIGE